MEERRTIPQYPNYEVTRNGEIYSKDRVTYKKHKHGVFPYYLHGRKLKPGIGGNGYKLVVLSNEDGRRSHYVHRLVAEAFIPNPNNLPYVNHKDEDRTHNDVSNLEWCTMEYNFKYGTAVERQRANCLGRNVHNSVPVLGKRVGDKKWIRYRSMRQAAIAFGLSRDSVKKVCDGVRKSTKGCVFKWVNDNGEKE